MTEREESSPTVEGACHCGRVHFVVTLSEGLESPRRCDCSFCRMRGAVVVSAKRDALRVIAGAEHLRTYRFNTMQAEHHFCGVCGIYTHHKRRSNPSEISVNVACLKGVSPFDFERVPVYDGQVHHSDRPGGPAYRIAGWLTYESC